MLINHEAYEFGVSLPNQQIFDCVSYSISQINIQSETFLKTL